MVINKNVFVDLIKTWAMLFFGFICINVTCNPKYISNNTIIGIIIPMRMVLLTFVYGTSS